MVGCWKNFNMMEMNQKYRDTVAPQSGDDYERLCPEAGAWVLRGLCSFLGQLAVLPPEACGGYCGGLPRVSNHQPRFVKQLWQRVLRSGYGDQYQLVERGRRRSMRSP